ERNLSESLDDAGEARAILTELLLVDPRQETTLWLLRGSILTAVDHVLVPLKLEDRARLREQQQSRKPRLPHPGNVLLRDMITTSRANRLRSLVTRPRHASRAARLVLRRRLRSRSTGRERDADS